uniref:Uncharacterized protein n=1 Tax=Pseudomonas fluorescens (strain SBW25) TaxID=216595 RepID=A0A0G4E543_PSEFS|nr:hypothetical protein PQBR57_0170 [Pseudomonas fluorescens SBW25]
MVQHHRYTPAFPDAEISYSACLTVTATSWNEIQCSKP